MTNSEHIKNAADKAAGQVKKTVGELTDDERLEAEGRAQKAGAAADDAVEDVKDAVRDAKDSLTE